MIGLGRPSRLKGAGFYDYDENGRRTTLWSGLAETFPVAERADPDPRRQDRMLFIEAIETAKCFEEGVITSAAAANIGSIMGIGFPANTGGAAQFMTGWQALDETGHGVGPVGLDAFLARADELADGVRRAVPPHGVPPRPRGEGRVLPRLTSAAVHPGCERHSGSSSSTESSPRRAASDLRVRSASSSTTPANIAGRPSRSVTQMSDVVPRSKWVR